MSGRCHFTAIECDHPKRDARVCGKGIRGPGIHEDGGGQIQPRDLSRRAETEGGCAAIWPRMIVKAESRGRKESRRPPTTSRASSRRRDSSPPREPTATSSLSRSAATRRSRRSGLVFHGPDGQRSPPPLKTDFTPLAIGVGATLEKVPVVFAGYGITAHDEAQQAGL